MKTILGKLGAGAAILVTTGTIILIAIAGQDALVLKNKADKSQVPWTAQVQTELLKRGIAAYAFQIDSEFDSVVYTKANMKFDSVMHGDSIILIPNKTGWRPDSIRVYRIGWVKYRDVKDTLICIDSANGVYEERDVDCYRKEIISDYATNTRLVPEIYTISLVVKRPKRMNLARARAAIPR